MTPQLPKQPFLFALHFIKHYKWFLLAMLVFEAGQATSQILLPKAIQKVIDTVTSLDKTSDKETLFSQVEPTLWTFVWLSLSILFFSRASGTLLVYVGPSLRRLTRYHLYQYLQHHSHRFFTSTFSGSLSNRISEVAVGINHSLWIIMFEFWPVLITFAISMVLLIQVHMELALYLGLWLALYITVSFALAMRAKKYAQDFAAARSRVSGKIIDSVTNIFNTQLFSRLQFERDHLEKELQFEVGKARRSLWFMEKMSWFQFIAALILQVGIMYLAVLKWMQEQSITVGEFTMVTGLSLLIINNARGLSRRFLEFFEYIGNISDGVGL